MKKILLFVVAMGLMGAPAQAAMNFYRDANGKIVAEATTCQDAVHLMDLMGIPDDPPGGDDTDSDDDPPANQADVQNGLQILLQSALGGEGDNPSQPKSSYGISEAIEDLLDAASFDERQDSFITFVRDVNWKTGLHITFRDFSVFRRLRMACSGINQLTKPIRMNLEMYTGSLDQVIEQASDAGVQKLAQAARGHSFNAMTKLSLVGLAIAIEKENPFILLALDEETYNKLVEYEPKIAELFEDMYMFFKIRSVRMGDYNQNIKALIDIVKLGKGDSFNTWHIMAEYAKKLLEVDRQGKLSVEDERDIHIWRLESSMRYIREQVRVERRAAELAVKDPQNAALVQEVKDGPKQKLSLNDKAYRLLQTSTQDEIKHLILKYKGQ